MLKIRYISAFIILFILLGILWRELFFSKPNELPSVLIGQTLPSFTLPTLFNQPPLASQDLRGRVSLLNVWATWCYACSLEHPMLMKIHEQYHIPIYSILYKDNAAEAQDYLQKNGNPYVMIGNDHTGDVAIDLGVYGTPETYLISAQGEILYRHIGIIDQKNWDEILYPLIRKYET